MNISDYDILSYTELQVDLKLMNATKVYMYKDDRIVHIIPARTKDAAFELCMQIEKYRNELENEAKTVSDRNS